MNIRRVRGSECEALIRFIAALNRPGPQHCLHFAGTEAGIRADIERGDMDLTLSFWLAEGSAGWRGVVGVMRDGRQGWLYGPWAVGDDSADADLRASLLAVAMAPPDLQGLHAFTDVDSTPLVAELNAAGFGDGEHVHVMRARRERWLSPGAAAQERAPPRYDLHIALATPAEYPTLERVHDVVLSDSNLSGRAMMAYANQSGLVLVAHDAIGGVLGSVCLALDPALREAEVEFLAVLPGSRRQGVGSSLLQAALDEALVARRYHSASLCVVGANAAALGLYTANGFERVTTGVKQHWRRQR